MPAAHGQPDKPTLITPGPTCARLTAVGRGAIAVVAVAGPQVRETISALFQPFNGKPFSQLRDRDLVYGCWQATGEDVVVLNLGEPTNPVEPAVGSLEIHCHGGTAAVDSIICSLVKQGATQVDPGDFNRFATGDFWVKSVLGPLQRATTQRTAEHLLRQLDLLPAAIAQIVHQLKSSQFDGAVQSIDRILDWSKFGETITQVPAIVLCGQPNVGKSSLINAIVGFERAIVHDMPGTTRDVVTQQTALAGWPVELKDTAGLRESDGTIEQLGIEHAREQIGSARLVLGVFDASEQWNAQNQQLLESLACDIVVHNKSDQLVESDERPTGLLTSATTRDGIERLIETIATKLVPDLPPPDAAFCVAASQVECLQTAKALIENRQPGFDTATVIASLTGPQC